MTVILFALLAVVVGFVGVLLSTGIVVAAEYIAGVALGQKPQILARREKKQLSERELDALYARETADGVLEKMVAEAERQAERDFYGLEDEPLRRRYRFGAPPYQDPDTLRIERNRNVPADPMSTGWRLREEKENGTRPDRLQAAPDRPRAVAGGEGVAEPVHPL